MTNKYEDQTEIVTHGPVSSDLGRTAAVKVRGRTRDGPEDGVGVTSLPEGVCRGGERVFYTFHSCAKERQLKRILPLVGFLTVPSTVLCTQQAHKIY